MDENIRYCSNPDLGNWIGCLWSIRLGVNSRERRKWHDCEHIQNKKLLIWNETKLNNILVFFSLLILFILPRHSNSVNVNVWSWYIYLFHFLLQHQESNVYVQPNVSLLSQSLRFVSNQYSAKADTHTFMSLTQDSLTHSLLCINKLKYDSVSQCMLLNFLLLPPSSVVPSVLPQNQHLAL